MRDCLRAPASSKVFRMSSRENRLPGISGLFWLLFFLLSARQSVAAESSISLRIQRGTVQDFVIPLSPDPFRDRSLVVRLLPEPWPADLAIAVIGPEEGRRNGMPVGSRLEGLLPFVEEGRKLRLRVQANSCIEPRDYEGSLEIWAPAFAGQQARLLQALPLAVRVGGAGMSCVAARSAPWGAGLLTLALVLYLLGMCLNSHFISARELPQRITPVMKEPGMDWIKDERRRDEVPLAIERDFGFISRAKAWIKANPLVFGLPGQHYEESAQLLLTPRGLSILPQPERRFLDRTNGNEGPEKGHLFVSTTRKRELVFLGRKDGSGRICGFEAENLNGLRWRGKTILSPPRLEYDHAFTQDDTKRGWRIDAPRRSRP